ncbi:MAG: DNA recombination protein RmuC [Lysobacter sp.]|nr:MAG: DNA recombination protein RmuC [Lysobacter sp.]
MTPTSALLILVLAGVLVAIGLLVALWVRVGKAASRGGADEVLGALREEMRVGRLELRDQLAVHATDQERRSETLRAVFDSFRARVAEQAEQLRETLVSDARTGRAEQAQSLAILKTELDARLLESAAASVTQVEALRLALGEDARKSRSEAAELQRGTQEALLTRLAEISQRTEQRLSDMRATLEAKLRELQDDNAAKLEQMRVTVDEKLHATLETRLTESFGNVTSMLAKVHQGLGDMSKLAADVGGLQRVLTNVKSRGVFGEVQLAALLEQALTPDQYASNVATIPGSSDRVEFAVRFPGSSSNTTVWLPIDAKFPREDYERLLDAQEKADIDSARSAGDALERRVRAEAARICSKYVSAPHTTEFAILFLPTEGLYAEVLRRPGLVEALQRDCRIAVAGPTTLLALMTSFQMGFRTLAIEKRSSEVWQTLSAVKTEFAKFGVVLDGVQKKLSQASTTLEEAGVRSRAMERKLRDVETLPGDQAALRLGLEPLDAAPGE